MKVVDEGADFVTGDAAAARHASRASRRQVCASRSSRPAPCTPRRRPIGVVARGVAMIDAVWEMARRRAAGWSWSSRRRATCGERSAGGPIAAVIALEGADPLEGRAENLRWFVERGVRSVIFAWKDNEFSGTAFGTNDGLSREGERLLGLAEELSVVVDVSHLSDQAFADVCGARTRPFIASHSNCRALCPHPAEPDRRHDSRAGRSRRRDGHQPRSALPVARAGRRVRSATRGERRRGNGRRCGPRSRRVDGPCHGRRSTCSCAMSSTRFEVGGEDAVGLGGDLDGIDVTPAGIESVADYALFPRLLRDAGLSERQIEKICSRQLRTRLRRAPSLASVAPELEERVESIPVAGAKDTGVQ